MTLSGDTAVSLRGISGALGAGTYTLMTYASRSGGTFTLDQVYPNTTLNVNSTSLTLTVGAGGALLPLIWVGDGGGNVWDVGATSDWAYVSGGTPTAFANGVEVILDDTATNLTLNLGATVSPAVVTFNSTKNYLIQGAGGISGGGGLTKANSGILTFATTNTYTGGTTVGSGTLLVNGTLGGGAVTVSGGTLGGSGSIGGPVSVAAGGTLSPSGASGGGNFSLGTLTVNGAVTLAGTTSMEISKDGLLWSSDRLVCGGTLTYGGTLTVSLGVNFTGGESFQLFSAANFAGAFAATNLPAHAGGLGWVWNPATGTLSVSGGTNTTYTGRHGIISSALANAGPGGFTFALGWPAAYRGGILQSNSVNLADTNYWFDVPGSETVTNLNFTITDPATKSVFYRLRVPASVLAGPRQNVVFFIIDDLTTTLGCYGHPDAYTPVMDSLAGSGVRFARTYTQYSLCNPSRSSFFTGQYPERTKIYNLVDLFREALPEAVTLPQLFKNAGYNTARLGKVFHVQDPNTVSDVVIGAPLSLDENIMDEVKLAEWNAGDLSDPAHATGNKYNRPYGASPRPPEDFTDYAIASNAIVTLDTFTTNAAYKDKPFFLTVGFIRPHTSWVAPTEFFDHITPTNAISMPYYFVPGGEDISTNNVPAVAVPGNGNAFGYTDPTLGQVREGRRAYLAAAAFSDSQVGRVMAKLNELNLATNTIIVLTGDNGYCLGEHNRWSKPSLFDIGIRVPLIVSAPGYGSGVCTGMVEQVDIYPTLAALAGLPISTNVQGMSLQPYLTNPALPAKTACFSTFLSSGVLGHSVTTDRYSYVKWGDGTNGITWGTTLHQFYDHATDPLELTNLANFPAYSNLVVQLHTQLTNHVVTAGGE